MEQFPHLAALHEKYDRLDLREVLDRSGRIDPSASTFTRSGVRDSSRASSVTSRALPSAPTPSTTSR
jgi:hypothetical protein